MQISSRPALPGRAELLATGLVVAAVNALSRRYLPVTAQMGPVDGLAMLFDVSPIIWFALFAVVRIGLDANRDDGARDDKACDTKARWADWLAFALLALSALLPTWLPSAFALLCGALYTVLISRKGSDARSVGLVALSLTGPLLLGPIALDLAGPELLGFDATLAAGFSGYERMGNLVQRPDGVAGIFVAQGCSAFNNVTLAFVFMITLTQLLRTALTRSIWLAGCVAVCAVVIVNGIRLAALARFPDHFDYLHMGGGARMFAWISFFLICLIVGFATLRSQRHAI